MFMTFYWKSLRLSDFCENNSKALHYEVGSLRLILQRIRDTVTNMNEEVNGIHQFLVEGFVFSTFNF